MCGYRQKAVQLEVDRQNQQRNKLLARIQGILDQAQVSCTLWSQVWVSSGRVRGLFRIRSKHAL